jgi:hypothetical protein
MKREALLQCLRYVCGISLETVKEYTIKITRIPYTPYFIHCFKMNYQIKFCSIMPLLVMTLMKEENSVHTSQKLKLCIEELHLTSLLSPKLLPEFRLGVTSSNIPNT